jgi:hypothetical protein
MTITVWTFVGTLLAPNFFDLFGDTAQMTNIKAHNIAKILPGPFGTERKVQIAINTVVVALFARERISLVHMLVLAACRQMRIVLRLALLARKFMFPKTGMSKIA